MFIIYKIYIFVRTKDNRGKKFSKGKLAGQVGHVCMKMGVFLERFGGAELADYIHDGEVKLVFKIDHLGDLMPLYHPQYLKQDTVFYETHPQEPTHYASTVKDTTTGEYIALAVLTEREIDTRSFKLL